jgi:hypothetical protein
MLSKSLQVSWQVVEKNKSHAERSEASAVSYWKRIKQILRFAQDDVAQGLFNNLLDAALQECLFLLRAAGNCKRNHSRRPPMEDISRCLQNMVTVRNCSAAVPAALFKAGKMPALRRLRDAEWA